MKKARIVAHKKCTKGPTITKSNVVNTTLGEQ